MRRSRPLRTWARLERVRTPTDENDKRAWRRVARSARRELDLPRWSADLVGALRAWPAYRSAATVATYLAFGDEADLGALLDDGKRFAAPRTGPPGTTLTFHEVGGCTERHALGMPQPLAISPRVERGEIDLVLVPGLAFDRHGTRLGRGAGHYDAWLASMAPGTPLLGVTHARLVVPKLPAEAHDVAVTHLLTPEGVRAVAG